MGGGRRNRVAAGVVLAAGLLLSSGTAGATSPWVMGRGGAPALGDAGAAVPAVGLTATPHGDGYWVVASDGSVYSFGDATYHGGANGLADAPVVGMATTPDGGGYWLAADDGAVYSFGDATYHGGTTGVPVVAMVPTPDGGGYWLAADDGSVYSFGDATYHGGATGVAVVGMAATGDGLGYWLVASTGAVYAFGDATYDGATAGPGPAVGIARRGGGGYWVAFGPDDAEMGPDVASYAAGRMGNVTAAVYDRATGRTTVYGPGVVETTASVEKVDILATLLSQAQAAGRALTAGEQSAAAAMVQESDNDSATALWNETGQGVDEAAYNASAGMGQTAIDPAYRWGFTTTTALDQVTLMRTVGYPGPSLTAPSQALMLDLMSHVDPTQAWGVSAGPGLGDYVALKNGWYPTSPIGPGGWQVNSIGLVQGHGRDYAIAILTAGDPSEAYGIDTIEGISSLVWQHG